MAIDQSGGTPKVPARSLKPSLEVLATLSGTLLAVSLLILTAIHAGPLWRDEVNTANVARTASLHDLWQATYFESFPPLWPLLLRACSSLGLADSDVGIRILGLYVGVIFFAVLWLVARWTRCKAPIISVALLSCLPAFVFIIGSNRAYGLASCLLVLTFGTVWRMVERPSIPRIAAAFVASFLFAHCVYYDAVLLAAIMGGGGAVTLWRRQWRTFGWLFGIGVICAMSLVIYLPFIRTASALGPMLQWPYFSFGFLWNRLGDAVTLRSSGGLGPNGFEIWIWVALVIAGALAAIACLRAANSPAISPSAGQSSNQSRSDLALFAGTSMVLGIVGMLAFYYHLRFPMQKWYFIEMLCLCTISLDVLLGANWPTLRPGGFLRIAFMVVMMAWGFHAASEEAHTRRSNLDLVSAVLKEKASDKDLVVVENAWEGITFNRYYHGPAAWTTVPPVDSHQVHRNDLVVSMMDNPTSITPVLDAITNTLASGHTVWLLGYPMPANMDESKMGGAAQWLGTHLVYWNAQVSAALTRHSLQEQILTIPGSGPISCLEDLPMIKFSGYKSTESTNSPQAK